MSITESEDALDEIQELTKKEYYDTIKHRNYEASMKLEDSVTKMIWKYKHWDGDKVTFEFDATGATVQELFFKWVDFMSACGYVLDKAEMESMWNGE